MRGLPNHLREGCEFDLCSKGTTLQAKDAQSGIGVVLRVPIRSRFALDSFQTRTQSAPCFNLFFRLSCLAGS